MILAGIELARRVESAEMRLSVSIGAGARTHKPESRAFVTLLGAGTAVYAGPQSPANKIIGVGLDEVPDQALLDAVEHAYFERNSAAQAEIATLSLPAVQALFYIKRLPAAGI